MRTCQQIQQWVNDHEKELTFKALYGNKQANAVIESYAIWRITGTKERARQQYTDTMIDIYIREGCLWPVQGELNLVNP